MMRGSWFYCGQTTGAWQVMKEIDFLIFRFFLVVL